MTECRRFTVFRMFIMSGVATALYLAALMSHAAAQTPVKIQFDCVENSTEPNIVAITNGVSTTVRAPSNTGKCFFTLECRDSKGKTKVGADLFFGKTNGTQKQSFSCPANAGSIVIVPKENATGKGELTFIP
jgi:hypothetical protein